jgi:hypothetical protein
MFPRLSTPKVSLHLLEAIGCSLHNPAHSIEPSGFSSENLAIFDPGCREEGNCHLQHLVRLQRGAVIIARNPAMAEWSFAIHLDSRRRWETLNQAE